VKIHLLYVGKARDSHANAMAAEYIKRSTRYATCEMREIVPAKFDPWAEFPRATKVLLDPLGKAMDSMQFSRLFERDLVFVIGGTDGLPADWRPKADLLVQLTAMTLPHELARVVLAEQIYRALTIQRGHPYPR
jgi:23S rRNA (pseudouridine1915-N3)-methyltransferase